MSGQSAKRVYATGVFLSSSSGSQFLPEGRHLSGSNYIFADGHVKWLKATSISPGLAAPRATANASQFGGCYNAAGTDKLGSLAATFSPR